MASRSTDMACALALIAAVAVASPSSAQPGGPKSDAPVHFKSAVELTAAISKIDAMYAAAYNKEQIGSYTIGVVSGPTLVWTKSYGMADMENQVLATKDTVYRIGSVTKEFTAVMLAQLVGTGKVHLADPVERYFPRSSSSCPRAILTRRPSPSCSLRATNRGSRKSPTIPRNI